MKGYFKRFLTGVLIVGGFILFIALWLGVPFWIKHKLPMDG